MWLFALFVAVPILEIALFIQVGGFIGLWATLAIVILTAVAGSLLLRLQGVQTLGRLQNSLSDGRNPMDPIAHGAIMLVSAVLLLTPGFFTDAVGLTLLIPPVRSWLIKSGAERMAAKSFVFTQGQTAQPEPTSNDTVEGEYVILDDEDDTKEPTQSGWTNKPE